MILFFPDTLPNCSTSYNTNLSDFFKKSNNLDFFYENKEIIRKNNTITVNFNFSKKEYIIFEDFLIDDLEECLKDFYLKIEQNGIIDFYLVNIFSPVSVSFKNNNFVVSFVCNVKQKKEN